MPSIKRNLQTLVKCITLRRTKGSEVNGRPLVSLPEKTVCVEQVELSQSEREEYELARNEGRNTIARYMYACPNGNCIFLYVFYILSKLFYK